MEILQTIWTALTTPNEGLINIISIPLAFLDAYIGMIFFSTCLNIKSSRKQKIIYVCTFSVLALIINMVLPNLYSTFVRMILWPILVILILKTSVLKGILSEVVVLVMPSIKVFSIIFYC